MPRARLGYGRPTTRVIPDGWAAAQAPVADATRTCPLGLRHPGTTSHFDDATQQRVHTPFAAYWTGLARVQAMLTGRGDQEAAGDLLHVAGYLVTVPLDGTAEVKPGDLLDVDASYTDDPTLAGRSLLVEDVVRGSLEVERALHCTLTDDV
jgi:hypothetical protein